VQVLTQPDRPAGRGMKLQASPVKHFALDHHLRIAQPRSLRLDGKYPDDAAQAREGAARGAARRAGRRRLRPDPAGLGAGAAALGCINIHASLLPRWRGAAPIHRAIEGRRHRDRITIMQMDAGLDTGDMLLVERLAIRPDDTTASLHDRLCRARRRLIVEALEIAPAAACAHAAAADGVTYAHKIEKAEAAIDWRDAPRDRAPAARVRSRSRRARGSTARRSSAGAPRRAGTRRPAACSRSATRHHRRLRHGALRLTELQRPAASGCARTFLQGAPPARFDAGLRRPLNFARRPHLTRLHVRGSSEDSCSTC
jgi:methionyl-tRNA formyltransferase